MSNIENLKLSLVSALSHNLTILNIEKQKEFLTKLFAVCTAQSLSVVYKPFCSLNCDFEFNNDHVKCSFDVLSVDEDLTPMIITLENCPIEYNEYYDIYFKYSLSYDPALIIKDPMQTIIHYKIDDKNLRYNDIDMSELDIQISEHENVWKEPSLSEIKYYQPESQNLLMCSKVNNYPVPFFDFDVQNQESIENEITNNWIYKATHLWSHVDGKPDIRVMDELDQKLYRELSKKETSLSKLQNSQKQNCVEPHYSEEIEDDIAWLGQDSGEQIFKNWNEWGTQSEFSGQLIGACKEKIDSLPNAPRSLILCKYISDLFQEILFKSRIKTKPREVLIMNVWSTKVILFHGPPLTSGSTTRWYMIQYRNKSGDSCTTGFRSIKSDKIPYMMSLYNMMRAMVSTELLSGYANNDLNYVFSVIPMIAICNNKTFNDMILNIRYISLGLTSEISNVHDIFQKKLNKPIRYTYVAHFMRHIIDNSMVLFNEWRSGLSYIKSGNPIILDKKVIDASMCVELRMKRLIWKGHHINSKSYINEFYLGYWSDVSPDNKQMSLISAVNKVSEMKYDFDTKERSTISYSLSERFERFEYNPDFIFKCATLLRNTIRTNPNRIRSEIKEKIDSLDITSISNFRGSRDMTADDPDKGSLTVQEVKKLYNEYGITNLGDIVMRILKSGHRFTMRIADKIQYGGVRELMVQDVKTKACNAFMEHVIMILCSYSSDEMISKPGTKQHRQLAMSLPTIDYKTKKLNKVWNFNADMSKWGPNMVPAQFKPVIDAFSDLLGDLCPLFHKIIDCNSNKLLIIPRKVRNLWDNPEFDETRLGEKERHLYDHWVMTRNPCIKQEYNMGQGILHNLSSLLHTSISEFQKQYIQKHLDVHVENILSSDDRYMSIRAESLDVKKVIAIMEKTYKLSNIIVNYSKSNIHKTISEFNSNYGLGQTYIPPNLVFLKPIFLLDVKSSFCELIKAVVSKAQEYANRGSNLVQSYVAWITAVFNMLRFLPKDRNFLIEKDIPECYGIPNIDPLSLKLSGILIKYSLLEIKPSKSEKMIFFDDRSIKKLKREFEHWFEPTEFFDSESRQDKIKLIANSVKNVKPSTTLKDKSFINMTAIIKMHTFDYKETEVESTYEIPALANLMLDMHESFIGNSMVVFPKRFEDMKFFYRNRDALNVYSLKNPVRVIANLLSGNHVFASEVKSFSHLSTDLIIGKAEMGDDPKNLYKLIESVPPRYSTVSYRNDIRMDIQLTLEREFSIDSAITAAFDDDINNVVKTGKLISTSYGGVSSKLTKARDWLRLNTAFRVENTDQMIEDIVEKVHLLPVIATLSNMDYTKIIKNKGAISFMDFIMFKYFPKNPRIVNMLSHGVRFHYSKAQRRLKGKWDPFDSTTFDASYKSSQIHGEWLGKKGIAHVYNSNGKLDIADVLKVFKDLASVNFYNRSLYHKYEKWDDDIEGLDLINEKIILCGNPVLKIIEHKEPLFLDKLTQEVNFSDSELILHPNKLTVTIDNMKVCQVYYNDLDIGSLSGVGYLNIKKYSTDISEFIGCTLKEEFLENPIVRYKIGHHYNLLNQEEKSYYLTMGSLKITNTLEQVPRLAPTIREMDYKTEINFEEDADLQFVEEEGELANDAQLEELINNQLDYYVSLSMHNLVARMRIMRNFKINKIDRPRFCSYVFYNWYNLSNDYKAAALLCSILYEPSSITHGDITFKYCNQEITVSSAEPISSQDDYDDYDDWD